MKDSSVKGIVIAALLLVSAGACEVRVESSEASGADAGDATARDAEVAVADVPDRPVSGTVKGRPFAYEDGSIENGILELRQGEDFFPDLAVKVFLFLDDETRVPEGRTWNVDCDGGFQADAPHVHVSWKEADRNIPGMDNTTCDYRLYLSFDEETAEKTLPGRIRLDAPTLETEVAGRFEAAIKGFRLVDGQVDLTQDDLRVAEHLAQRWLSERHGRPIEIVDDALGWLHTEKPEGRPQAGYAVYWWRPADAADTLISKLQFVKRDGTWRVERELELWQVSKAHPLSPRADLGGSLERRAAQRFEAEHVATKGRRPVFVTRTRTSYNPRVGLAEVQIHYRLDSESARSSQGFFGTDEDGPLVRYLFRTDAEYPAYKEPDAWRLDRRLRPGETVDYKAGRVIAE